MKTYIIIFLGFLAGLFPAIFGQNQYVIDFINKYVSSQELNIHNYLAYDIIKYYLSFFVLIPFTIISYLILKDEDRVSRIPTLFFVLFIIYGFACNIIPILLIYLHVYKVDFNAFNINVHAANIDEHFAYSKFKINTSYILSSLWILSLLFISKFTKKAIPQSL